MTQSPIIRGFEPWLKVQLYWGLSQGKEILFQFGCFFTLHINSPHYQNINNSDFAIEFIGFVNLQIYKYRKGLDLGH